MSQRIRQRFPWKLPLSFPSSSISMTDLMEILEVEMKSQFEKGPTPESKSAMQLLERVWKKANQGL